jgi:hypothetical protein
MCAFVNYSAKLVVRQLLAVKPPIRRVASDSFSSARESEFHPANDSQHPKATFTPDIHVACMKAT